MLGYIFKTKILKQFYVAIWKMTAFCDSYKLFSSLDCTLTRGPKLSPTLPSPQQIKKEIVKTTLADPSSHGDIPRHSENLWNLGMGEKKIILIINFLALCWRKMLFSQVRWKSSFNFIKRE